MAGDFKTFLKEGGYEHHEVGMMLPPGSPGVTMLGVPKPFLKQKAYHFFFSFKKNRTTFLISS